MSISEMLNEVLLEGEKFRVHPQSWRLLRNDENPSDDETSDARSANFDKLASSLRRRYESDGVFFIGASETMDCSGAIEVVLHLSRDPSTASDEAFAAKVEEFERLTGKKL